MRLALTESTKKFIETLTEEDLAKATIIDGVFESDDEGISTKLFDYAKARLSRVKADITELNKQLKVEHPEYFE